MKKTLAALTLGVTLAATGCGGSQADTAAKNLSTDAEQFKILRSIVGVNGITDKVEFEVKGYCSVEGNGLGSLRALTVTCRDTDAAGRSTYKKHFLGVSDNLITIVTQLDGVKVSEFHTKIILKPQGLVPDFDLVTG